VEVHVTVAWNKVGEVSEILDLIAGKPPSATKDGKTPEDPKVLIYRSPNNLYFLAARALGAGAISVGW